MCMLPPRSPVYGGRQCDGIAARNPAASGVIASTASIAAWMPPTRIWKSRSAAAAGSESGRIGNLNPQSALSKKKTAAGANS